MKNRVYVDTIRWYVRPNNTDWRYNFHLGEMSHLAQEVSFYYPRDPLHTLRFNLDYTRSRLFAKMGAGRANGNPYLGRLNVSELRRSGCQIVYAHWAFPTNAEGLPVLWHNSIIDPSMRMASGTTLRELEEEATAKGEAFRMAAAVQVSTGAERNRLTAQFPDLADKFVYIPFFLPYLKPLTEEEIVSKHQSSRLELLFVGRTARLKGLDILFSALESLGLADSPRLHVSVVSSLSDGPITVPRWTNLTFIHQASRREVDELMRHAHIFVMPSRSESYGFTFIEAMSQGTVPIVPNWEVQNEIVDFGNAGCTADPSPASVAACIDLLMGDSRRRLQLALAAAARCRAEYLPRPVAQRYAEAFRRCVEN